MSYNLKDFLSFKLNINPFEELAFAGSSFSMPKKDLSHISKPVCGAHIATPYSP